MLPYGRCHVKLGSSRPECDEAKMKQNFSASTGVADLILRRLKARAVDVVIMAWSELKLQLV